MKTKSSRQSTGDKGFQSKPKSKKRDERMLPSAKELFSLRQQGVEFEAELAYVDDEQDTGVGSGSVLEESQPSAAGRSRGLHIVGRADIYTDAPESSGDDKTPRYREIDSDTAKQLDAQYMHILQNKSGVLSDKESIRTEDFEEKYKELLPQFKELPALRRKASPAKSGKSPAQVERYNEQFKQTRTAHNGAGFGADVQELRRTAKSSGGLISSTKRMGPGRTSDVDSVRTEEFQPRYKESMIKHIANVPLTSFDRLLIDSDLDTVTSRMVQQKLQPVFTIQQGNELLEYSESDEEAEEEDESDDDESSTERLSDVDQPMNAKIDHSRYKEAVKSATEKTQTFSRKLVHSKADKSPPGTRASSRSSHGARNAVNDPAESTRREVKSKTTSVGHKMGSREGSTACLTPSKPARERQRQASEQVQSVPAQPQNVEIMTVQSDLFKLQSNLKRCQVDKENLEAELKLIQQSVRRNQTELKSTNQQLKEVRLQSEDARTELMLKEFKRDAMKKEVEQLSELLADRKQSLQNLLVREEQSVELFKKAEELGITKEELSNLVSEREDLRNRVKHLDNTEKQRQEAVQQVAALRDDIGKEQKAAKEIIDSLKKEIENRTKQIDDLKSKLDGAQRKVERSDGKCLNIEKEKNQLLKEKTQEYDELQRRTEEQVVQMRISTSNEVKEVRQQLTEMSQRLAALQLDFNNSQAECSRLAIENKLKGDSEVKYREQILELKHQIVQLAEKKDSLIVEHQSTVHSLYADKEQSLEKMRKEMIQSRQAELEKLRLQLENDNTQKLTQLEQQLEHQHFEKQGQLLAKEAELKKLKDDLNRLQLLSHDQQLAIHRETEEKIELARASEKKKYEEKAAELEAQLGVVRGDYERTIGQLRVELQKEFDKVARQQKDIEDLCKELEVARQQASNNGLDRLLAEEEAQSKSLKERKEHLERLKSEIAKETSRSLEGLRQTIRQQEEDLSKLRAELASFQSRHYDSLRLLQSQELMLVNDMNEECKRIASALGTTPRLIHSGSDISYSISTDASSARSHMVLGLANIKASVDDLLRLLVVRQQELQTQREEIQRNNREKKEDMEVMKSKLLEEKERALEHLKNRLIKDHLSEIENLQSSLGKGVTMTRALQEKDCELQEIQKNMNTWKDQTADKLAKKFQEEMSRELDKKIKDYKKEKREWEREKSNFKREIEKMERESQRMAQSYKLQLRQQQISNAATPMKAFPVNSSLTESYIPAQSLLKADFNVPINRHPLSGSVPDLSAISHPVREVSSATPSHDNLRSVRQLESKVEQLETRARLSEEKAMRTEEMLSQKLSELSRVQSSFNQQNKEELVPEQANN